MRKCRALAVDKALLPEGQDALIVGATAMLFHNRAASLEAIARVP